MQITRRADYGIRMLVELASRGDEPVSVRDLAERTDVPYAFARSVQRDLSAANLVESHRGAKGGITLSRPASQITLLDIVSATQGMPSVAVCSADPDWCARAGGCSVHQVWRGADKLLHGYLHERTLAGLIDDRRR